MGNRGCLLSGEQEVVCKQRSKYKKKNFDKLCVQFLEEQLEAEH